jgi:hypothetical protein
MEHEWDDFIGMRVRVRRRPRHSRFDVYQPSGWNSPGVRKAVSIYWRTTLFIVKMLLAIQLSIMVVGSVWMIWVLVTQLRFN